MSTGVLTDQNESKTIYMNIMLYSVMLSAFVFPIVGQLCDKYSPKISVPFAFIFRGITTLFFSCLTRPDSLAAYGVCVLMIIGTIIENISVDSIFNKNLPKETRGVLGGLYSFAG